MKSERKQIAVKIETTPGTAETLAAADVIRAYEPVFTPSVEMHDLMESDGSLSAKPKMPGAATGSLSFKVWLRGSGTAGTPADFGNLLKACGLKETDNPSTVLYAPSSDEDDHKTVTIGYYVDGKRYLLAGAMGNAAFTFVAGKPCYATFTFSGNSWLVSDVALLTGVTYQTTLPPIFKDGQVSVDGETGCIENITINLNNKVQQRPCANAETGFAASFIGGREITFSLDPEAVLATEKDWYAEWLAGSTFAFEMTLGSAAGNLIKISAPALQLTSLKPEDKNGMLLEPMECMACGDSGDDEILIEFDTAA